MKMQLNGRWKKLKGSEYLYSTGHYLLTNEEMKSILAGKESEEGWEMTVWGNSKVINIDSQHGILSLYLYAFNNPFAEVDSCILEVVASSTIIDKHQDTLPAKVKDILKGKKSIEYRNF